ncbi:MAG TPA: hypothetical protein VL443_18795 [Cyclobacteriaceae bacterium]|nr:hypothetical protein [Cyclobacteriaceae bacterium]
MIELKQKLFDLCYTYVSKRIETANDAIKIAQASANEETKSSAGDKYETGRAMMQLEIEKNTVQLHEAMKLKQMLDQLQSSKHTTTVQSGSLVITDSACYYIAISAGQLTCENKTYFAIAPTSPIGILMQGLKSGESFIFNKKKIVINEVM